MAHLDAVLAALMWKDRPTAGTLPHEEALRHD
jgi:hypothetical protein